MKKRVFIVHGWSGSPDEWWFPWLKTTLEEDGFFVDALTMPETDEPKIEPWVSHLASAVGEPDVETYFVGHSIGCQTIMRYLERLLPDKNVGGAVFVAGWFTLNLQTDKEKAIAKPWLETPIDFEKIEQHTKKFVAIFSDDDAYVPLENKKWFEERLGAKTLIEHHKGHYDTDEITTIPCVYEALKQMSV